MTSLPRPGDFLVFDFRTEDDHRNGSYPPFSSQLPMIKCIQWNIERGYKIDEIIQMLKRHRAHIICLQELDISCARTRNLNVPFLIAKALKMKCVFVTEFEEIESKLRNKKTQGGGVHGNAILSYYDFEPFIVAHSHHPINWEKDGHRIREPRKGRRLTLGANIRIPGLIFPIRCYCLHLEVFCGIFGRLKQFADVMEDAKASLQDYPYQIIFGDLNTNAHGIARLSPYFCSDNLRLGSIGYSEAQWWSRHIFDKYQDSGMNESLACHVPKNLSNRDIRNLINPHFYDPFCPTKDTTLHSYFGLYRGKLDWTLIRGMYLLAKGMDNHDFEASDHKLLHVVLKPVSPNLDDNEFKLEIMRACQEGQTFTNHHRNFYRSILSTIVLITLLTSTIYFALLSMLKS